MRPLDRHVKQPITASFVQRAEMLSILIKMGNTSGINLEGNNFTISQFADDTTLFLRNE